MKIAMLGQKGVPAHSGGVEQHVDMLSRHLVARGHEVVVYCRRSYCGREARSSLEGQLHRVVRPSIPTKHLDALTHTLIGTLDVILRRADVVHYHAVGPAALAPLARLARLPVVVTVHALDAERAKWGPLARRGLRMGEWVAARSADKLVVVSPVLRDHFMRQYEVDAEFIPNAVAPMDRRAPHEMLRWGLAPRQFVLAVARLVPEKGLHHLIRAFAQLPTSLKLVIAGDGDPGYQRELRRLGDTRVSFVGDADREFLAELYSHALLFVLPSAVEGMSIALLEAMSMGVPVLVSDIPANACVVGDAGFLYRAGDVEHLRAMLDELLTDPSHLAQWSAKVSTRAAVYRWPDIVQRIENVYRFACDRHRGTPTADAGESA